MRCIHRQALRALLAASALACSPSAPESDAPPSPEPRAVPSPPPETPSAAPEVPAFISALAETPLPGEWSVVRNQGLVLAGFRAARSRDFLVAVACFGQPPRVEFIFAPPPMGPLRVPRDPRLIMVSVITRTNRLDLSAVDWSPSEGRFEVRAMIDPHAPNLLAVATPQERIAFETDYFDNELKLVFPWDEKIATVLEECGN
jgi:hypothetical protein